MKLSMLEYGQRNLQKGLAQTPSSVWRGSLCSPLQKAAGEVAAQSQLQDWGQRHTKLMENFLQAT